MGPFVIVLLKAGGLQSTGEVEGGGGDLAFFGVGGFDLPSCAFCCCLHFALLFLNQTCKIENQFMSIVVFENY